ncbi:MAG TPA: hypothetical protein VGN16_11140 [Acidobacteriaceae bacterium]|jgi:hypothetical protein
MMKRSAALVFLLGMMSAVALGQRHADMVVFEIPPGIQTLVPVTPGDIEARAFKVVYLKNDRLIEEAQSLIQNTNETFEPKMIRAKIKCGTESYVFDSEGVGVSSHGKAVKIDFNRLREILGR